MRTDTNDPHTITRADGTGPKATSDDGVPPARPQDLMLESEEPPDLPPILDLGSGSIDADAEMPLPADAGEAAGPAHVPMDEAASGIGAAPSPGASSSAAPSTTCKSWTDLIMRWKSGRFGDIEPRRSSWGFAVRDDILLRRRGARWAAVAVLATAKAPRSFYYDVAIYRRRLRDRIELESMGFVPVLPFELAAMLRETDRSDLAPKDVHHDDVAVLDFVRRWLVAAIRGEPLAAMASARSEILKARDSKLIVKSKGRSGVVVTTIAELATDGRHVCVAAHLGRSPTRNLIKDAVWVAVSRLSGLGQLPEGFGVVRVGTVGGPTMPAGGKVLRPAPTPASLLRRR